MLQTATPTANRAAEGEARAEPRLGRGSSAVAARRREKVQKDRRLAPAMVWHGSEQHSGIRLSQIVRDVRDQFLACEVDDVERLVRGVILCLTGRSPIATVSHEPTRGHLRIDVRLDRVRNPEEAQVRNWLAINGRAGLAGVWWDPEDGVLWLRGVTHCRRLDESATTTLRVLIRDIRTLLRQETIAAVMNRASSGTGGQQP